MYIQLDERRITDAAEAMDLPGLHDKYVTGACLELLSVNGPETATFVDELDFIVRMPVGPRATPRKTAEEERGDIHVSVIGPDEMVRAPFKR
jgi:hypothetical protein